MHEAPGVSPRLSSTGAALLTTWQIVSTTARLLPAGANAGSAQPSDRASMVEAVLSPPTPPAPKPTAPPPPTPAPTPNGSFAIAPDYAAQPLAAPDVHMRAIAVRFGAAVADRTAQAAFLAQRISALDAAESVMVFADLAGAPTDPALAPVQSRGRWFALHASWRVIELAQFGFSTLLAVGHPFFSSYGALIFVCACVCVCTGQVFNALADVMSSFTNGTYVPTTDDGTTSDYIFFRYCFAPCVFIASLSE